jgi:hypothetical protein
VCVYVCVCVKYKWESSWLWCVLPQERPGVFEISVRVSVVDGGNNQIVWSIKRCAGVHKWANDI